MAHISTNVHVHDDDQFELVRRVDDRERPYYRLHVGSAVLFLSPDRVADLLAAVQPMAERAAEDTEDAEQKEAA